MMETEQTQPQVNKRRILVPMDTNRMGESKVAVAVQQAQALNASCILLHVVPSAPPGEDTVSLAEAQALTYLNAVAARLRAEGVVTHCLVRHGNVADEVVQLAERDDVLMIIIGSNPRRGLPTLLGNNLAHEIMTRCNCLVLVVPPDLDNIEQTLPIRSFDEDVARTGPVVPRSLGIRTISLSRIVGSVGRAADLTADFRMRNPTPIERERYERVRARMDEGVGLPPIQVYKLGYGFYVLDGNHRVAAAKAIGQLEIEAEVTEYVPIEDPQAQRVFLERRAFELNTGRTQIGATLPGSYPRLEGMIRHYARTKDISDIHEASHRWEALVYRPVARRIREMHMGHIFPDHRTADVFVRLVEFREQQRAETGVEPSWEEALVAFRDLYCPHNS